MRYVFEIGEVRYVWLDEEGERTSQYHKTIPAAYAYRRALLRHLSGRTDRARQKFEPQGSGKAPARLAKLVFGFQYAVRTREEWALVDAAELLAQPTLSSTTLADHAENG